MIRMPRDFPTGTRPLRSILGRDTLGKVTLGRETLGNETFGRESLCINRSISVPIRAEGDVCATASSWSGADGTATDGGADGEGASSTGGEGGGWAGLLALLK